MLGFLMFSGESKENVEKERVESELKDSHPVKFFKNEEYKFLCLQQGRNQYYFHHHTRKDAQEHQNQLLLYKRGRGEILLSVHASRCSTSIPVKFL